jgi:hypothetical protein
LRDGVETPNRGGKKLSRFASGPDRAKRLETSFENGIRRTPNGRREFGVSDGTHAIGQRFRGKQRTAAPEGVPPEAPATVNRLSSEFDHAVDDFRRSHVRHPIRVPSQRHRSHRQPTARTLFGYLFIGSFGAAETGLRQLRVTALSPT